MASLFCVFIIVRLICIVTRTEISRYQDLSLKMLWLHGTGSWRSQ